MRIVAVGVALSFCSMNCFAAEVGIGVSVKSNDASIYMPIDWSQKYRIEPSIRVARNNVASEQPPTQFQSGSSDRQKTETLEVGIGAFRTFKVADSVRFSAGLRLAYVDTSFDFDSATSSPFGSISDYHSESSQNGYRIAPTIGFEYMFGEHFSIGGEASYSFLDTDGDGSIRQSTNTVIGTIVQTSTVEASQRTQGTNTQLILRYMF